MALTAQKETVVFLRSLVKHAEPGVKTMDRLDELVTREGISDARTLAALFVARQSLRVPHSSD